jgi:hypothetical protein
MAESILDPRPLEKPSDRSVNRGYSGAVLMTPTGSVVLQKRHNKTNTTDPNMIHPFLQGS